MFSIDGQQWPYPCDIARTAEIRSSEVSGLMLDGTYYNDVLGTFMQYTVKLAVPFNHRDTYAAFYEMITAPVEGHTFVFPYNNTSITITGRVENISDVYVRLPNGGVAWKGIQFTVTSNVASKENTLEGLVSRGADIFPAPAAHNEGDSWTWHNDRWVLSASYDDADATRY